MNSSHMHLQFYRLLVHLSRWCSWVVEPSWIFYLILQISYVKQDKFWNVILLASMLLSQWKTCDKCIATSKEANTYYFFRIGISKRACEGPGLEAYHQNSGTWVVATVISDVSSFDFSKHAKSRQTFKWLMQLVDDPESSVHGHGDFCCWSFRGFCVLRQVWRYSTLMWLTARSRCLPSFLPDENSFPNLLQ